MSEYVLSQLHFVCIYAIVGFGLMLLVGYTGQISLGHAAFLAVGAYTEALLQAAGVPFVLSISCAALFSAAVGIIVGLPALRLKGIYLAIATLAFNVIVEEIVTRWESLTGGNQGKLLKPIEMFGYKLTSGASFYYLCLALTVLSCLALINLLRSPTGRAFVAIRDSEVSASCMGINLARYKTMSFALSAALTGIGGALYAHKVTFISPEQFTLIQSIELVTIVIIGGIGSLHGAVLGARLHHHAAAGHRDRQGLAARDDPAGRPAIGRVRPDPDRVHHLRALRPLRPLAEDPHLFRRVPVLPPRHVPPPALLSALGAAAMSGAERPR